MRICLGWRRRSYRPIKTSHYSTGNSFTPLSALKDRRIRACRSLIHSMAVNSSSSAAPKMITRMRIWHKGSLTQASASITKV